MSELIFHFGKYKGEPLSNVPNNYLNWVIQNSKDARAVLTAEQEFHRRGTALLESGQKATCQKADAETSAETQSQPSAWPSDLKKRFL